MQLLAKHKSICLQTDRKFTVKCSHTVTLAQDILARLAKFTVVWLSITGLVMDDTTVQAVDYTTSFAVIPFLFEQTMVVVIDVSDGLYLSDQTYCFRWTGHCGTADHALWNYRHGPWECLMHTGMSACGLHVGIFCVHAPSTHACKYVCKQV